MNYSIITTCDKGYFPFLEILTDSISEICDLSKINNFFIVDTGLTLEQRQYLLGKLSMVTFIETDLQTNFEGGIWGDDWAINVGSKTVTLYETLKELDHSLLMLDADMEVLRDLKDLKNYGGDIQVCYRPNNSTKYIGSYFFALNPLKALPFVKKWKDITLKSDKSKAFESPALVRTIEEFKNQINIVELNEELVNVYKSSLLVEDSFLIHYKSDSLDKTLENTLKSRLNRKIKKDV